MGTTVDTGTLLLGKYRVERVLGKGGMGMVVLAHHEALDERVAIKFLRDDALDNPTAKARFLREARAAVKLKSEHVARVSDVGTLESGAPYMIMEYLDGADLADFLGRHRRLTPGVAVDLILQACEALAEAHSLGIVHRDIKPSNFFLTHRADGSALLKVLDFGISKGTNKLDTGLTSTQALLGTPLYMSPEQMRSTRQADARSDIWSLGVVLYELLTGLPPFDSENFAELCVMIATEPVPPMPHDVPPMLAAAVVRCLDKDPTLRFSSVAELGRALAPFSVNPAQAEILVERSAGNLRRMARTDGAVERPETRPSPPMGPWSAMSMPSQPLPSSPTTFGLSVGERRPVDERTPTSRKILVGAVSVVLAAAVVITIVASIGSGGSAADPDSARPNAPAVKPTSTQPAPKRATKVESPAADQTAATPTEAAAVPAAVTAAKPAQASADPTEVDTKDELAPAKDESGPGATATDDGSPPTRGRRGSRSKKRERTRAATTDDLDDDEIMGTRK